MLLNFVAFQLCWFANVLGAANGLPWTGPVLLLVWIAAHLGLLRGHAKADIPVLVAAVALGWLADSGQVLAGFISFPEQARLGAPTTVWMVALWAGFAATLRHSLGWLRGRTALAALLGAVGGALSYSAGQALGAIELAGGAALASVAVQFAIATPLLLGVVARAERAAAVSSSSAGEKAA